MHFQNVIKKERTFIIIFCLLFVFSIGFFINMLMYPAYALFYGAIGIILFISALVLKKKHQVMKIDTYDEVIVKKYFDRYTRRSMNWLLGLYWLFFSSIANVIPLIFNSKLDEIVDLVNANILLLEIILFFFLINTLLVQFIQKQVSLEHFRIYKNHFKKINIISLLYWGIAQIVMYLFESVFVLNLSLFFTSLYVAGIVVYNFTKIEDFVYEKKRYKRIVAIVTVVALVLAGGYRFFSRDIWLTQPYINKVPYIYTGNTSISYNDQTGIYTITNQKKDFKILQLTDIHLGGGVLSYDKDMKALQACFKLLKATKPDFVIVTGDLTFPVGYASFSFNNTAPVSQFAAFMRNTGIPWAFTYGNHDTENYAATDKQTLNKLYKSLSFKTSRNLLYPYKQPKIHGRNNQLIELRNHDGSLNQALFLMDSNAYTGKGFNKYDYIHDDQVNWYKDEIMQLNKEAGRIVPSQLFFHIPLQQYRTAYKLYEKHSPQVQYYFGRNDEKMMDKVNASDHPSKIFDEAKRLGSTKYFYCGHDHYNNMSLEYQGIRLTYGMSIDYLAMPGIARDTRQRGGTLITVSQNSQVNIKQVPLTSLK